MPQVSGRGVTPNQRIVGSRIACDDSGRRRGVASIEAQAASGGVDTVPEVCAAMTDLRGDPSPRGCPGVTQLEQVEPQGMPGYDPDADDS